MVNSCSALYCKTRWKRHTNTQFHRFPLSDKVLLEKWIHQVGRKDWRPTKNSALCSKHFTAQSYKSSPDVKGRKLLTWAVPTIFDSTPSKCKEQEVKPVEKTQKGHVKRRQHQKSLKCDQNKEACPHIFKIQDTEVEIKFEPNFSSSWHDSEEEEELSVEKRISEEPLADECLSCEWSSDPCPHQCDIQQTVEEMQAEYKRLRVRVKSHQQKLRRRDRTIKQLRKRAGLADG